MNYFICKLQFIILLFLYPRCLARNFQKAKFLIVPETKIIGGYDCKKKYDYMVALMEQGNHICGGTLIRSRWILSAAHCDTADTAVIGVQNLKLISDGTIVRISYIKRHPQYDIALFRTDTTVNIKKKIRLPKRPLKKDISSFCSYALVMGWGDKNKNGEEILQCVFLNPVPRRKCEEIYEYKMRGYMCAFTRGKDNCYGDSGGPLICAGVQYGVVHGGMACGDDVHPGIYTSVDKNIRWIQQVLYPSTINKTRSTRKQTRSKMSANFPGRFFIFLLILLLNTT